MRKIPVENEEDPPELPTSSIFKGFPQPKGQNYDSRGFFGYGARPPPPTLQPPSSGQVFGTVQKPLLTTTKKKNQKGCCV